MTDPCHMVERFSPKELAVIAHIALLEDELFSRYELDHVPATERYGVDRATLEAWSRGEAS